jgi:hypothetical protein
LIPQSEKAILQSRPWLGGRIELGRGSLAELRLQGAALKDLSGLFNSSLKGNVRRAIDIHQGDKIDEEALI